MNRASDRRPPPSLGYAATVADGAMGPSRRGVLGGLSAASALGLGACAKRSAAGKITFLTNWFAEAEHGGFYQAAATGLFQQAGLNVEIKMGGPQINASQLLLGGDADIIIGHDIQVLKSITNRLPVLSVGAPFQFDLQGIMTHANIHSLAELKGHKVQIAQIANTTWWPWLKEKYGYTDDMIAVDTFNLQPFLHDPSLAMEGVPSSEPYEAQRLGADVNFFMFADEGYPPYGNSLVTTRRFVDDRGEDLAKFVRCVMQGWVDFFKSPAPGNRLMMQYNPQMTQDRLDFAIQKMAALHVLDRGDGAKYGVGTMTLQRWIQTRDFLAKVGLLPADLDVSRAFTARFTKDLRIFL
jgi:NitT/TauT family transport system substrate-binding protein